MKVGTTRQTGRSVRIWCPRELYELASEVGGGDPSIGWHAISSTVYRQGGLPRRLPGYNKLCCFVDEIGLHDADLKVALEPMYVLARLWFEERLSSDALKDVLLAAVEHARKVRT